MLYYKRILSSFKSIYPTRKYAERAKKKKQEEYADLLDFVRVALAELAEVS